MESSCASAPPAREPENIEAAGKARERETNTLRSVRGTSGSQWAGNQRTLPRGDSRECGTRETNVSEKETAAVRRDGEPLTSAVQERRQEETAVPNIRQLGSRLPCPGRGQLTAAKDVPHQVCLDPGAGDQLEGGGCRSEAPRPSKSSHRRQTQRQRRHTRGLRRQLIQFLKDGSEYFTPKEVCRIIRAARLGAKGSLNPIDRLGEDMQLFMHEFPDAEEGELREQCRNTVLEYEESMRVWEELKDTGKLDSSDTDSEEEEELTGKDLLQALDKAAASPTVAPKAVSSCIDWPKRVLRQTILASSIAAEIRSNINRTDWDKNCY
jgi:hypothetical protein